MSIYDSTLDVLLRVLEKQIESLNHEIELLHLKISDLRNELIALETKLGKDE